MVNVLISTGLSIGIGLLQRAMTPDTKTATEGSRLTNSQITAASEGVPIPRIYRRFRVGGEIIWTTTFREVITKTKTRQGGKGGGPKKINTNTEYTYYCSFAVGLCEGEAGVALRNVYLDGALVDISQIDHRFYSGDDAQTPDPRMEAVEGAGNVPAYRGLSYIVFNDLDLTPYGNRIPQVSVEVVRLVPDTDPTALSNLLRAVQIIPSSGEFIYSTEVATSGNVFAASVSTVMNIHTASGGGTDLVVSLDTLKEEAPAVDSASLVVAWFGSDVDATVCEVKPKVETNTANTTPPWRVADRTRATAEAVPSVSGSPVYGGTPTDYSVRQAMREIKARGMRAMFYPFILMDSTGFPWRGRIEGDATNLMGTAAPGHFGAWDGTVVPYTGPSEWTLRRMILHYAALLRDVLTSGDAFIVGSEMVGLSNTDSGWGARLVSLIADVRSILPAGVKVSYAADWSEYKVAQLGAVWSSADFIGIDNYLPLTDWHDGEEIYHIDVFKAGIEGGEYWDYFYADDAARASGTQTPITDPQYRQKDIRYWATTNHPGKPVWFTEFGCPAIDKGANQPNVFYDPKSSESAFPYRSNGDRNDTVQRLYLEAMLDYWGNDGFIDPANMFVWTWDARPYPAFPSRSDVWADGDNWERGHWLTGRLGTMTLARLVTIIMRDAGIPDTEIDVTALTNSGIQIVGMGVFDVTSPRDVLENLMTTYNFDVFETGNVFRFVMRKWPDVITLDPDGLIHDGTNTYTKTRTQDTDLPDRTKVKFRDEVRNYELASVDGHTITGYSTRVRTFETFCVLAVEYAQTLADTMTQEAWTEKNGISFSLPLTMLKIENGDVFEIAFGGVSRRYRVKSLTFGDQIDVEASGYAEVVYDGNVFAASVPNARPVAVYGAPLLVFADLPVPDDSAPNMWSPRVGVTQRPWPGAVLLYEDDDAGGYGLNSEINVPCAIGETLTDLPAGVTGVFDLANSLTVRLYDTSNNLTSAPDKSVLNGGNVVAILTPSGDWEVLQFATAVLNSNGTFTLSRLLRGVLGTEHVMGAPTPAGSRFLVYDLDRMAAIAGSENRMGLTLDMRYGPYGVDVADSRYRNLSVVPQGVAYRPYSPAHLAQSNVGGDITLSWIRRTRMNGDNWDATEVPLNEEIERYRVIVYSGAGAPLRTIVADTITQVVYTSSEQTTDFGAPQASVDFGVAQYGSQFGGYGPERRFGASEVS